MNAVQQMYKIAQHYLPGGVCATARANQAIGHPLYMTRADGARVTDLDGREYIDMCMSHGASLLGHNHPRIKAAIAQALDMGIMCSYETVYHTALAKKITELTPCADMVRFAGSGTETIMHGLRLARAVTGREKIIKIEGHFHGYSDGVNYSVAPPLDQAGPANAPIPYPHSAGMPQRLAELLVLVPFNDFEALENAFVQHGQEAAMLIMEPINYDAGCIIPRPGFAELCRELCDRHGVLLFFDEVLTAFRLGVGSGQAYLGVTPDLCVLGKAFGGGAPISALAGKKQVMEQLRPVGDSEMSGTYLAHLTTVLAALAALEEYSQPGFYDRLALVGDHFYRGFQEIIERSGVPVRLQYAGPRFGLYFGLTEEVTHYRDAARQNQKMLYKFIEGCIKRNVYFAVSPHHGFSAAHTEADLGLALEGIEGAMADVKQTHPTN